MDEIKKWDLQLLPGFEAIEEPEKRKKDLLGDDDDDDEDDYESPMEEYEDEEVTLRVPKKEESKIVTFTDEDLDEGLLNAASDKILKENSLILPSKFKNKSYQRIRQQRRIVGNFLNDLKEKKFKK